MSGLLLWKQVEYVTNAPYSTLIHARREHPPVLKLNLLGIVPVSIEYPYLPLKGQAVRTIWLCV